MATTGSTVDSKGTGEYVRELKPHLPVEAFEPARSRLWWLPLHVSVIAVGIALIALKTLPVWALPIASLVIGASFAGLVFLGHETLHGGVVRGKRPFPEPRMTATRRPAQSSSTIWSRFGSVS